MKHILLSLMLAATTVPTANPTPHLTNVAITPATSSIAIGASEQLQFIEIFSEGPNQTVAPSGWTSASPAVATVDTTGRVTGVAAGVTSISATLNGLTARVTVSVQPAQTQGVTKPK